MYTVMVKLTIRQGQLNVLLYEPDQPQFLANQNNNTDFTWKHVFSYLFYNKIDKIDKKIKNLVHLTLLSQGVKRCGCFHM